MPKTKPVTSDFDRFLAMYESLNPDEKQDILNLMEKWAGKKPHCKQIVEKLVDFNNEKQKRNNDKRTAAVQRFKLALGRLPATQTQLEIVDKINRRILKSMTQQDQITACTLLNESLRDTHYNVFELNHAYQNYQEALVDSLFKG